MAKFLRRDVDRYSKFGNGRGKKAKWRKPKGRDNKMREKKKGYTAMVSIGYSTDKKERAKINSKDPVTIRNVQDLEKLTKNQIGVVQRVGKKTKLEIAKKAKELKVELKNLNADSYIKKNEKKEDKK